MCKEKALACGCPQFSGSQMEALNKFMLQNLISPTKAVKEKGTPQAAETFFLLVYFKHYHYKQHYLCGKQTSRPLDFEIRMK